MRLEKNVVLCITGENNSVIEEFKKQIMRETDIRSISVSRYLSYILSNDGIKKPTKQQLLSKREGMEDKKLSMELLKFCSWKIGHSLIVEGVEKESVYKCVKCLVKPVPCILIFVESDTQAYTDTLREIAKIVITKDINSEKLEELINSVLDDL